MQTFKCSKFPCYGPNTAEKSYHAQEQTEKNTSGQRILNRFSSIFQCFSMKSQAICLPTWLFSATLPITNGAFDDLIFLEFREN